MNVDQPSPKKAFSNLENTNDQISIETSVDVRPRYHSPNTTVILETPLVTFITGPGKEWVAPVVYIILIILTFGIASLFRTCQENKVASIWFHISAILLILNIIFVSFVDPGHVINSDKNEYQIVENNEIEYKCDHCKVPETERNTEHCYTCNVCVRYLDHHCPVLGNCIGKKNIICFYLLILVFTSYFMSLLLHVNQSMAFCYKE